MTIDECVEALNYENGRTNRVSLTSEQSIAIVYLLRSMKARIWELEGVTATQAAKLGRRMSWQL